MVDEHREKHRKLLDKLSVEEAQLVRLGNFRGVPIFAVRAARWSENDWAQWVLSLGQKLGQTAQPRTGQTHTTSKE
jgi:hypothetical protein